MDLKYHEDALQMTKKIGQTISTVEYVDLIQEDLNKRVWLVSVMGVNSTNVCKAAGLCEKCGAN